MSDEHVERLVAEYLEEREDAPALTPGDFAARHADAPPGLEEAIRSALDVSDMFPDTTGVPARVGEYSVVREIGRGGMGLVYEVERDGERFALKLLALSPATGMRAIERFRRETSALVRLSHPNIVTVHDAGTDRQMPYIVMDLLTGASLAAPAPERSIGESVRIVRALADAVAAAHEIGILHRDLKPHNVMLTAESVPVLLDFGLMSDDDLDSLTSTGDVIGTPRYMSPEQVEGAATDARTDVHGLGLILYELVAGRPAYDADTRATVMRQIASGRYRRPRKIRPDVPRDLARILEVALATAPRHRYASAAELRDDLDRFLAGQPVVARPPGLVARSLAAAVRHRVRTALSILLVLATSAAIYEMARPRESPPTVDELARAGSAAGRGIARWLDGDREAAAVELRTALELDPQERDARVLLAFLESDGAPSGPDAWSEAVLACLATLGSPEHGVAVEALGRLPEDGRDSVLASVLLGRAALSAGDLDTAERELIALAKKLPGCATLAVDLGDLHRARGDHDRAVQEYERAVGIDPGRVRSWKRFADALEAQGDLERGIEAIRRARELVVTEDESILTIQAKILDASGEREEARRLLREILERNPRASAAQTRLAYSLDSEHRLVEAAREYERAIELDPDNVPLLICLANLHAGADRGRCKSCDAAYAESPEVLDAARSESLLLDALDRDRGRDPRLPPSLLQVILKLEDRGRVIERLREMTEGAPKTPAVLRLESMSRRLMLAEGGGSR